VHRINNFSGEKLCPGHFCFAQWRKTQSFFPNQFFSSPDPGKEYTVKCALERAVPDLHHLEDIREAVLRTNQCTYLATELVNLYVRYRIENHDATGLEKVFDRNWLIKAYYAVSEGSKAALPAELVNVYEGYMKGTFQRPNRSGITQALLYECTNLAAVGSTNV
jgi:hypothetical protein